MRQVLLASVRVYARRYVAAAVAVVVSAGFVVAIGAVTSATRNGILDALQQQFAGADLVVTQVGDPQTARRLVHVAEQHPGVVASVNAVTFQPVVAPHTALPASTEIGTIATDPRLRWQTLTAGHFPQSAGQALVDAHVAAAEGIRTGDMLRIGNGARRITATVTGLARSIGTQAQADLYLTPPDVLRFGMLQGFVENVVVAVPDGDTGPVTAALQHAAGPAPVQPTESYVREELTKASRNVDTLAIMLLVFAAIAVFVSELVIANTFTIMLAQRTRDFALLRCVGATRRQVLRAVRAEAAVIGAASATVGVLAGLGFGQLLTTVGSRLLPAASLGAVTLSPAWLAGGWLVGFLVTLEASMLPARRATRVSPLAALRPETAPRARTRAGVLRLAAAGMLLLGGAGLLAVAERQHQAVPMVAGGAVSFLGVLLTGPLLMPGCVRIVGLLPVFRGVPGRLAVANALRNPRRTATTAGSLLVGVTLVAGLLVGMATIRTSVSQEMDVQYPVDASVTAPSGLGAGTLAKVRALDGVRAAVLVRGVRAHLAGPRGRSLGRLSLLRVPGDAGRVTHGRPDFLAADPSTLFLPWTMVHNDGLTPGDTVQVRIGGHTKTFTVAGTEVTADAGLVSGSALESLAPSARPLAVWVRSGQRADPAVLHASLQHLAAGVGGELAGSLSERASMDTRLTVMTVAVLCLLGAGVLIALVGIGATIGLSVLERGREHALLRAIGLTRGQLRATLAVEAVLLALVAGVLGVAIGTGYAWIGAHTVLGGAIGDISLTVPYARLAGVVAAAAVAGLLACLLPARRAARVTPAAGLSAE